MSYTAEISRSNPTCFLFLIDQSQSMAEAISGSTKRKADALADVTNRLLQTLVLRSVRGTVVLDRFHVGVIGYGSKVASVLAGELAGRNLVPLSAIALHPLRVEQRSKKVEDGAGGLVEQTVKFPVWFEPVTDGRTPMCAALEKARAVIGEFLERFPACYPPLVINITDGLASDGNPEPPAAAIQNLASDDGKVLLFNVHLSTRGERPIEFPSEEAELQNDYAKQLFRMSSLLPEPMRDLARNLGIRVNEQTRGFAFNADLVSVIRFLDIGTRVDAKNLR